MNIDVSQLLLLYVMFFSFLEGPMVQWAFAVLCSTDCFDSRYTSYDMVLLISFFSSSQQYLREWLAPSRSPSFAARSPARKPLWTSTKAAATPFRGPAATAFRIRGATGAVPWDWYLMEPHVSGGYREHKQATETHWSFWKTSTSKPIGFWIKHVCWQWDCLESILQL